MIGEFNSSLTPMDRSSKQKIKKKLKLKNTNTWRVNNMFINNQQFTKVIKREIKKFLETNDNKNTTVKLF